ncbi:MAG: hypothetical protein M9894_35285 [Planctomycetes bacterium]|nr:hypothetical protein [Planctomycetota bacterium]
MLRSAVLAVAGALALAGCAAPPPAAYDDLKEVYCEPPPAEVEVEALRQVPFPLSAEAEAGIYSVVRSLRTGPLEGQRRLARMLGQWPPPGVDPADPAAPPPVIDLTEFPRQDPPVLLLATSDILSGRDDSGCYLGHAAFAGGTLDTGAREVIHHLRVFVVNQEAEPLRLRPEDVALEVDGLARLERLAAADEDGARLDALVVAPGEGRVAHVFFSGTQVPPALVVRWRVTTHHDPRAGQAPRVWEFEARVMRRFVLNPGRVTALEDAVARRLPLPAPRARPGDPWREPRMEPVGR